MNILYRTATIAALSTLAFGLAACDEDTEMASNLPNCEAINADASVGAVYVGQPASAVVPALDADKTRVIAPDSAVTADYREERLNLMVDDDGIITEVGCY